MSNRDKRQRASRRAAPPCSAFPTARQLAPAYVVFAALWELDEKPKCKKPNAAREGRRESEV